MNKKIFYFLLFSLVAFFIQSLGPDFEKIFASLNFYVKSMNTAVELDKLELIYNLSFITSEEETRREAETLLEIEKEENIRKLTLFARTVGHNDSLRYYSINDKTLKAELDKASDLREKALEDISKPVFVSMGTTTT